MSGPPSIDHIVRFGIGPRARHAATTTQDELRAKGTIAAALFKLEHGGWVVVVYRGRLRARFWATGTDADESDVD